jgi:molybdopterin-guanine dinucleotide biosynthesis protein A
MIKTQPSETMPLYPLIATVILAGGYSRRMGRDKALVLWQGEPMVQRVYDVARSLTPRSIILSGWNDRYADLDLANCEFLHDQHPGSGPLLALAQALHDVTGSPISTPPQTPEWILLLACDLPSLDRDRVAQLCDRTAHSDDQTIAIVPRTDRAWEPLCALYRRTAQPRLQAFIQAGGRSFQRWLELLVLEPGTIDTVSIATDDRGWLHNCNSAADLSFPSTSSDH